MDKFFQGAVVGFFIYWLITHKAEVEQAKVKLLEQVKQPDPNNTAVAGNQSISWTL
jgi:hypothetical protein